MSDLLRVFSTVQVFQGTSTPPSPYEPVVPEVNVGLEVQINLGEFIGPVKQIIAASASDIPLTLPDQPYDAVFWLETDTPIEINVNDQGYVRVEKAYLSMSQTANVKVRNIIIPGMGVLTPIVATIRYFAGKIET